MLNASCSLAYQRQKSTRIQLEGTTRHLFFASFAKYVNVCVKMKLTRERILDDLSEHSAFSNFPAVGNLSGQPCFGRVHKRAPWRLKWG